MKISISIPEESTITNHGYGQAAYGIVTSLQKLGHQVPFQDPTAPVELCFSQPYHWNWSSSSSYKIGMAAWESTKIPRSWRPGLATADEIWTPSPLIKQWFEADGLKDVKVYQHGVDSSVWTRKRRRPVDRPIRFLHCLSNDTEILTADGWRGMNDVHNTDVVATLNEKTNEIEYLPCRDKIVRQHEGKMVAISNWGLDILATDQHRILYRRQGAQNWTWGVAQDIFDYYSSGLTAKRYLPSNWSFKGLDNLSEVSRSFFDLPEKSHPRASRLSDKINLEDVLTLMGWYISEGSRRKFAGRKSVKTGERLASTAFAITQKVNQSYVEEIKNIIKSLGASPAYTVGGDIVASHSDLYKILGSCGDGFYSKRIPRWVFSLPPRLMLVLFEAMIKGDGSRTIEAGCYYTSSPGLRDDVQELLALCSYRTSVGVRPAGRSVSLASGRVITSTTDQYDISFVSKPSNSISSKDVRMVDYSGEVWCVSNDNGTLLTRRNGKVSVVGNCGEPAPRKGGQMTYDVFKDLFGGSDKATLTIKAHGSSRIRGANNAHVWNESKNVQVITEDLPEERLVDLVKRHDILVYPSYGEGFGLIPLQAMVTGMPVICTAAWAPYRRYLIRDLELESYLDNSPWPDIHNGKMFYPGYQDLRVKMQSAFDNFNEYSATAYATSFRVKEAYEWDKLTSGAFDHIIKKFS